MRFFCLHAGSSTNVKLRLERLQAACSDLGVEYCPLDSITADYTSLPKPGTGDLLYNCARGSETLESLLLGPEVATFYRVQPRLVHTPIDTVDWSILHAKRQLSAPKTVFSFTDDRLTLRRYVDYLGGFPVIIKTRAGTRGVGIIKVESWHALFSLADYLIAGQTRFIMREYIPNKGTARLVVLGSQVIASEFRDNLEGDFRVSGRAGEKNFYERHFSATVNQLAIDATHEANVETAGVDIICNDEGEPFLLEVNFPHDFVPPERVTGVPIALKMLQWLTVKSKKGDFTDTTSIPQTRGVPSPTWS